MLKRNLTLTNPLLQKKKPTILNETAGDITPSSLPPFDSSDNSSTNTTRAPSSTGANAGLPSWLGQRPATLDERFQLSINNNRQKNVAPEKRNVIFSDVLSNKYASAMIEVVKRNKQITGDVVVPSKKPSDSAGFPARPRNGEQTSPIKGASTPESSTSALTDEQSELAAIVDKLPESFDLTKWDDMTAFQQQNALKSSGLTGEEQMKLLNAPTSIQTIATIQDIQANRAQYGITQAAADNISSELLKIANARIGVNNRALPFASDFQRKLFLQQLDKEEQKLLESANRQENGGHDILFNDNRGGDSDKPVYELKPKIVNNVDSESKLGRTAKNILKYYLNARFLNRANSFMSNLEFFGDIINKGTISVGVSGNVSCFVAGGINGNVGLVMDSQGDVGVITSYGGYGGTPSASAVFFTSISNADDISNLAGDSYEAGGSISLTPTVIAPAIGGETSVFIDPDTGKTYFSLSLNGGVAAGLPTLPIEGHVGLTTSHVAEKFNLFDEWSKLMEDYKEW